MLFIIASALAYDPVIEAVGDGFIDWMGIHFNGQHQIHPKLTGERHVPDARPAVPR